MIKRLGLAGGTVMLAVLAACGGGGSDEPSSREPNTVELRDIEFKPEKLTVEAGTTVTWRFEDQGIPHDVVADDKSFKSEVQDSGQFQHTFDKPGTYKYVCTLHPGPMKGTIVVT